MSYTSELKELLREFDPKVFGSTSVVRLTEYKMPDLISVAGPIMYFLHRSTLIGKYPGITADKALPTSDFYLVHTHALDWNVRESSVLFNEGGSFICIIELAIAALISKITQQRIYNYEGTETYVNKGGMFSPEDIARLLKFDRSKIVKIKDDQNRGLEFYLNRYNDLSQASRVLQTGKARYIATVAAQTSTILYYVNWIYQHRGWKDALNCLRDMAEFRQ